MKNINILKLLTFLFIFIFVVFSIVFIFIVPDIKKLKTARFKSKKAYNVYSYTNNTLKSKEKELKELKHDNLKIIRAFDNSFDKNDFLKFSKKYFIYAKLIKNEKKTYKKDFIQYSFNTVSKIADPAVFYKFLTAINSYDNIIQVNFPIHMRAVGDDINTTFNLKVYTLKGK